MVFYALLYYKIKTIHIFAYILTRYKLNIKWKKLTILTDRFLKLFHKMPAYLFKDVAADCGSFSRCNTSKSSAPN